MASLQLSISLEALDSSKKFNSFCYGRASVVNSLNRVNAIKVSRLQSELPVDENLVEQNLDCSRHENEKGHSNTKKMSTFTMVHHTAPHIPFKSADEWNAAQAQLNGTVHCDYPSWIEILCHDINVHIPHHISPRIPSYNLRAAHKSIQENWGKYLNEATWNWRLTKTIMTVCHVYSKEQNYVPFDALAPVDSLPITFLKKVMPDMLDQLVSHVRCLSRFGLSSFTLFFLGHVRYALSNFRVLA